MTVRSTIPFEKLKKKNFYHIDEIDIATQKIMARMLLFKPGFLKQAESIL